MNERDKELAVQAGLKTYQEQAPGIDGMVGEWEAFGKFATLIRADDREQLAAWFEGEAGTGRIISCMGAAIAIRVRKNP